MKLFNPSENKRFLIVFVFSLIMQFTYAQSVFVVDNNQGASTGYTSVQAAINDAQAGDIIYLQPSPNNYGDIQMTKPLHIYGIGYNPELNNGVNSQVSNIFFRYADASNSKISGLNINGIYLDNTTFPNHNVVITNNRIVFINGNSTTNRANNVIVSGNFFYHNSIQFINNHNSQNWIISHNTFNRESTYFDYHLFYNFNSSTVFSNNIILSRQNGNTNGSIRIFSACSGASISNNIFIFTGTDLANFNLGSNSGLQYKNNLTYSYNTTLDALTGTDNLNNTDPQFVAFNPNTSLNSTANDFHIQTGSAAKNAGADGNDLGVFNGGFPFNLRGYPTELPYLTDFVIHNNIITPGETLNVNIKANANISN
ncbi:hypothetical protein LG651_07900 [Tamlana sp. 62-3]|uniref:Uncharacterized protein n=1 Tax=Neotamlana sargassicola TaxID=2883125 RepID=A0A9X1L4K5_9FLAO|nr:hypothetical protein [Tamlana sargassicola]MCB4808175.1 hypothetical protein [Tamlana sargassicola]